MEEVESRPARRSTGTTLARNGAISGVYRHGARPARRRPSKRRCRRPNVHGEPRRREEHVHASTCQTERATPPNVHGELRRRDEHVHASTCETERATPPNVHGELKRRDEHVHASTCETERATPPNVHGELKRRDEHMHASTDPERRRAIGDTRSRRLRAPR